MHHLFKFLTTSVLACALSCSFFGPDQPALATSYSETEIYGPSTVEAVEVHFHRYHTNLSNREIRRVAEVLVEQCEILDLDRDTMLAVIRVESGFNNFAISRVGALGLMQIMPFTGEMLAKDLGIPWSDKKQLFDPELNVRMGTAYLRQLHDKYENWDKALAAYNWGPARIDWKLANGRGLPRQYVDRIYASSFALN